MASARMYTVWHENTLNDAQCQGASFLKKRKEKKDGKRTLGTSDLCILTL